MHSNDEPETKSTPTRGHQSRPDVGNTKPKGASTMKNRFAGENLGSVTLLPRHLVRTETQVRTSFKDASIAELAADIRARGLLQPIVVRPNGARTIDGNDCYTVVIGERRFRALELNQAPFVPVIISQVSEKDRALIQLAENIQREDLSARDLASAVAQLWQGNPDVQDIARKCNKSRSWVSKRLTISLKGGAQTTRLLDAEVKDTELLYDFVRLEKANKDMAADLVPAIIAGQAGRREVKDSLVKATTPASEEEEGQAELPLEEPAPAQAKAPDDDAIAEKLATAITALVAIRDMPKALKPLEKWERARNQAISALQLLQGEL